ncbi:MAG: indole-3-glycerol phosphate synthase TrpC [Pseudomonadota bacterium]
MTILDDIIEYKKTEVAQAKAERGPAAIDREAREVGGLRPFEDSLTKAAMDGFGLIAEIKKASPSKGLIREDFHPATLAEAYQKGGAACLSVLTDTPAFQGHPEYLKEARQACDLPVLRKDFMVDPYQMGQARLWEADAVLLIMACLSDDQARELYAAAREYELDVLIEVHDEEELERALALPGGLLGVNNRNLHTFETDLAVSEHLAKLAGDRPIVGESGIASHSDCLRLSDSGIRRFLVGESLMRQQDVATATKQLLEG